MRGEITMRVVIRGRVQGVGFRCWTASRAKELELDGWVRNRRDGTVEAVLVRDVPGFALGVQWHPEYDWQQDAVSRGLFEAFGRATRDWISRRHMAQAAE